MHTYSPRERRALIALAAISFCGLNVSFFYGLIFRPESLTQALYNPIALAFIIEAFLLMGALAYFLRRWGITAMRATWFIALSLIGGLAFALPLAILQKRK